MLHYPFSPSFVVDTSSVWERKMEAVAAYTSQFQSDGSGLETALSRPDFTRFLKARALWFGAMIGAAYGEPFLTPGSVPLHELPGIGDPDRAQGDLPPYCTMCWC
jgi:LmbE family N-acetylglucosaminyl deacetylase